MADTCFWGLFSLTCFKHYMGLHKICHCEVFTIISHAWLFCQNLLVPVWLWNWSWILDRWVQGWIWVYYLFWVRISQLWRQIFQLLKVWCTWQYFWLKDCTLQVLEWHLICTRLSLPWDQNRQQWELSHLCCFWQYWSWREEFPLSQFWPYPQSSQAGICRQLRVKQLNRCYLWTVLKRYW